MGYKSAFPPVIPLIRESCSRVTHPTAGRHQGFDESPSHAAPRLACVKPAASVHPEPGSNSSLYIISLARFLTLLIQKELTLSIFLFLGTCLYLSYQSFNDLFITAPRVFCEADCKGRHYFLFRKNIFKTF